MMFMGTLTWKKWKNPNANLNLESRSTIFLSLLMLLAYQRPSNALRDLLSAVSRDCACLWNEWHTRAVTLTWFIALAGLFPYSVWSQIKFWITSMMCTVIGLLSGMTRSWILSHFRAMQMRYREKERHWRTALCLLTEQFGPYAGQKKTRELFTTATKECILSNSSLSPCQVDWLPTCTAL